MSIEEIEEETLKLILHASRSSRPHEFAGILRSNDKRITEVLILPGTSSSESSAIMKLHMLPISSQACGSVHSHPTQDTTPSEKDLNLFDKFGEVHIIVGAPYGEGSWRAYDRRGREFDLKVVKSEGGESERGDESEDFWGQ